jgi:hypothetical protein
MISSHRSLFLIRSNHRSSVPEVTSRMMKGTRQLAILIFFLGMTLLLFGSVQARCKKDNKRDHHHHHKDNKKPTPRPGVTVEPPRPFCEVDLCDDPAQQLYLDPGDRTCRTLCRCSGGDAIAIRCPPPYVFDIKKMICALPQNVPGCGQIG